MIKGDVGGEGSGYSKELSGIEEGPRDRGLPPRWMLGLPEEKVRPGEIEAKTTHMLAPYKGFEVAGDCANLLLGRVSTSELYRALLGESGDSPTYYKGLETFGKASDARIIASLPANVSIRTEIDNINPETGEEYTIHQNALDAVFVLQEPRTDYNREMVAGDTRETGEAVRVELEKILRANPDLERLLDNLGRQKEEAQEGELLEFIEALKPVAETLSHRERALLLRGIEERLPFNEKRYNMVGLELNTDDPEKPTVVASYHNLGTYWGQQADKRGFRAVGSMEYYPRLTGNLIAVETSDGKLVIGMRSRNIDLGGILGVVAEALSQEDTRGPRADPEKPEKDMRGPEEIEAALVEAVSRRGSHGSEEVSELREKLLRARREALPDPYHNAVRGLEEEMGISLQDIEGLVEGVHYDVVQEWVEGERTYKEKNVLKKDARLEEGIKFDVLLINHDGGTDFGGHVKLNITYDELREKWSHAHDGKEMYSVPPIDFTDLDKFTEYMVDDAKSWLHGVPELLYDMACRKFGRDEVNMTILFTRVGFANPEEFASYMSNGPTSLSDRQRELLGNIDYLGDLSGREKELLEGMAHRKFGEDEVRRAYDTVRSAPSPPPIPVEPVIKPPAVEPSVTDSPALRRIGEILRRRMQGRGRNNL